MSGNRTGRRRSTTQGKDRGVAAVEFALIVPIFIALIFGVISFGYMLSYRQAVSQAAAEGARTFAVAPVGMTAATKQAKATAAVNDQLGPYKISCAGGALKRGSTTVGTCSVPALAACPNDGTRQCATVTVTHQYRDHPLIPSFPGLGILLPQKLTYKAVVEATP